MHVIPYYLNGEMRYKLYPEECHRMLHVQLPEGGEPTELGLYPIYVGSSTLVQLSTSRGVIWNIPVSTNILNGNDEYALSTAVIDSLQRELSEVCCEYPGTLTYEGLPITVTYDDVIFRDLEYYKEVLDFGWEAASILEVDITDEFIRYFLDNRCPQV